MKRWLVITPTLGQSSFLAETVASVRALGEGVCHRVICPAESVKAMQSVAPEAEIQAEQATGLYAAIQQGAADATDFAAVTWLNDDDRLIATGTHAAWSAISRGAELVYGKVGMLNGRGCEWGWLPVCRRGGDLAALLARGTVALAQPGTWLSGSLWGQVGGVDTRYRLAGDLDLFWRAAVGGARCEFVPEPVARFRLRGGQLSQQQELGGHEKAQVLATALRTAAWGPRARFLLGNLGVYMDRVRRHGLVSMAEIYRRGGES